MPTERELMQANLQRLSAMMRQNMPGKSVDTEAERSARRIDKQEYLQPTGRPYIGSAMATQDSVRTGLKEPTPTIIEQAKGATAKRQTIDEGVRARLFEGTATAQDSAYAEGTGILRPKAKGATPKETIDDVRTRIGTKDQRPGDVAKLNAANKKIDDPKAKKYNKAVIDLARITEKQGKLNAGDLMTQEVFDSMEDWEKTIAGIKTGDKIDKKTADLLNGLYDRMKIEPEGIINEHDAEEKVRGDKKIISGMNKNRDPKSKEWMGKTTYDKDNPENAYWANPVTGSWEKLETIGE